MLPTEVYIYVRRERRGDFTLGQKSLCSKRAVCEERNAAAPTIAVTRIISVKIKAVTARLAPRSRRFAIIRDAMTAMGRGAINFQARRDGLLRRQHNPLGAAAESRQSIFKTQRRRRPLAPAPLALAPWSYLALANTVATAVPPGRRRVRQFAHVAAVLYSALRTAVCCMLARAPLV